MTEKAKPFLSLPAIRVGQPLGPFYITKMKAVDLLSLTHVTPTQIVGRAGDTYDLAGGQREAQPQRRKEIEEYIRTAEAAFPNSIILGANFDSDGQLEETDALRWRIEESRSGCSQLVIPQKLRLAAVIDGQHRLMGFENIVSDFPDFELPCAVYLDLPVPYQAYVFAVINFNQKKVDKSLAYEMFAFDASSRSPEAWAPETLAVHLCRRLNLDAASPFYTHIRVAPQNDELLFAGHEKDVDWLVSTATVVEGILRLITTNSKRDKSIMHQVPTNDGRSRKSLNQVSNSAPLRSLFISVNDKAIYTAVVNFFNQASALLWKNSRPNSYIQKTVGVQALFDVMRKSLEGFEVEKNISSQKFAAVLKPAITIDFTDDFFQASGVGRTRIKNCILIMAGLLKVEDIAEGQDAESYRRICGT